MKESFQSKKFILAVVALTLITGAWVAGNWAPNLAGTFSDLVSGIMMVIVSYYGGNLGNKFVVGKFGFSIPEGVGELGRVIKTSKNSAQQENQDGTNS